MILLMAALSLQDVEVEVRAAAVQPKFRLRDGEKWLQGDSVFSRELDAGSDRFSPGGSVAVRRADELFHFEFWTLVAEGDGVLEEPRAWGGGIVPAGTPSDVEVLFEHMEIGWRHRFAIPDSPFWLDAGVDVERMVVDADLGFGGTRLGSVFPTPQVALGVRFEWLELSAGMGGFFLPFRTGDTSVLDPIEYALAIRGRWDRYSISLGYDLYHVHFEENRDDIDEDVVHLRLRGFQVSLALLF